MRIRATMFSTTVLSLLCGALGCSDAGRATGTSGQPVAVAVTATDVPVATVAVTPREVRIPLGGTTQLLAAVKDSAGAPLANRLVTWSSADSARASVSGTGLVTGTSLGVALVVASAEGKSDTSRVIVKPPVVASVRLTPSASSLLVGQTLALSATVLDTNGRTLADQPVTWLSSDSLVAAVSPTGVVTARSAGTVTVTAASGGQSATATVQVAATPPMPAMPAELPRVLLDTRLVAPTGRTIAVRRGENLQAAIDGAQAGDVLLLDAGATYSGNFTLPRKTGAGWITIRTSTPDASLPPEGERVTPAHAPLLATISSPNHEYAIRTAPGVAASYYRLVGLEVTFARAAGWNYGLVLFGDGSRAQSSLAQVPHDLVIDRSYVHGHPSLPLSRCIVLNSARTAIVDSYVSECHGLEETNAIKGWNGPGPFKIVNNYLEAAAVNIMFGGVDPEIRGLVPSDIEIRRNHVSKQVKWKRVWMVKNLLELKNAQRVLVEGNVFENNWVDAQDGYAILMKSSNQSGGCTWCVSQDVTFRFNRIANSGAGINISAKPEAQPAVHARRIAIYGNVVDRINVPGFEGPGRAIQTGGDLADLVIEHNTFIVEGGSGAVFFANYGPLKGFRYTNNITTRGRYGILGGGGDVTEGQPTLARYAPDGVVAGNVMVGAPVGTYPPGNFFPTGLAGVGFTDPARYVWKLSAGSPYKGRSTDGTDPGADIDLLEAATRRVTP